MKYHAVESPLGMSFPGYCSWVLHGTWGEEREVGGVVYFRGLMLCTRLRNQGRHETHRTRETNLLV